MHRFFFILKQLARIVLLALCVSAVAFFLLDASPVDPVQTNVGQAALGSMSAEQIARAESYWGKDKNAVARYTDWARHFFTGDMGTSLLYRRPVADVLAERLSTSLWLMGAAWLLSGVFGFFLGAAAGARENSLFDKIVRNIALFISSVPSFWIAILFMIVFGIHLKILPIALSLPIENTGTFSLAEKIRHAILPAVTLSLAGCPQVLLHTREKMIRVMKSNFMLFAAASGESKKRIFFSHGLRNIVLPAISIQAASLAEIFGGSVLVEQVFSYPGIGQAAVQAGLGQDVPLLLGITVISALIVFSANAVANVIYGIADPRIRRRNSVFKEAKT